MTLALLRGGVCLRPVAATPAHRALASQQCGGRKELPRGTGVSPGQQGQCAAQTAGVLSVEVALVWAGWPEVDRHRTRHLSAAKVCFPTCSMRKEVCLEKGLQSGGKYKF